MAGRDIVITDQGSVIFKEEEGNGLHGVSMTGPTTAAADYTIKLPTTKPSGSGQMLNADVSGTDVTLSFTSISQAGSAGLNVLSQGALGDGATEDTSAFNTAFTASETSGQAQSPGGTGVNDRLIIPSGEYPITGVNTLDADKNYWIEGAGMGASELQNTGTPADQMIMGQASDIIVFRNLTFNGNDEDKLMLKVTAPYVIIDNVEFKKGLKALEITGAVKFISITNCRFHTPKLHGGPFVNLTGLSDADGCTVVFNDNYFAGTTPASAGDGNSGLEVAGSALDKNIRCLIRNNEFRELGKDTQGAIKITGGHGSVIEGNTFVDCVSTPIQSIDSKQITISNNKISIHASKAEATLVLNGIDVSTSGGSITDVSVKGNDIIGSTAVNVGVKVAGSAEGNFIGDVKISDNNIESCGASIVVDHLKDNINISNNTSRGSLGCTVTDLTVFKTAAMHIGNIAGDGSIEIIGNSFNGGASSGKAIHFDRSGSGQTAGEVRLSLRDNYIDSMAQHSAYNLSNAGGDAALVFIKGHSSTKTLSSVNASGNRYDFTSSQAIAYGMYVDEVGDSCTFDSVMEFGAVPDSDTDSTVAINRAGLAAGSGGSIYFPSGTFRLSDFGTAGTASTDKTGGSNDMCIEVVANDQLWWGKGTLHDTSTDESSGSDDIVLAMGTKTGITVRDLKFTNAHVSANTGVAVQAKESSNIVVQGCSIRNFKVGVQVASDDSRVDGCYISGTAAGGAAIQLDSTCSGTVVSGNTILSDSAAGTDKGIAVAGAKNVNVVGNSIRNTGSNAIDTSSSAAQVNIENNNIDMSSSAVDGNAISVDTSSGVTVCGNNIVGTGAYAAARQDIELNALTFSSVSNNTISSYQRKIEVSGTSNFISITGNSLRNNDGTPKDAANPIILGAATSACTVNGNTIVQENTPSAASKGLSLQGDDTIVTSNVFKGFHTGIDITAGAENNIVGFNRYMTGITTAVADAGTGSTIQKTETAGTSTFDNLHVDILRFGTQGADIAVGETNIINITNGFHYFHPATTADVEVDCITINGNHTLKDVGGTDVTAAEALACAPYDGMILLLAKSDTNTANKVEFRWNTGGTSHTSPSAFLGQAAGANLIAGRGADSGGGNEDAMAEHYSDSIMLRFEFSASAGEGYWRVISDAFTA